MRQRKTAATAPVVQESTTKTVKRQLQKLDIFEKVQEENTIQTGHGGVQTILTYIIRDQPISPEPHQILAISL